MDRDRFNGDGYRRIFMKGLGVFGCVRRGGVVHAEHSHDPIPRKCSLCKRMGWRGSDVGFPSRPDMERLLQSVALMEQVDH